MILVKSDAYLLIAGFFSILIASIISPPRLYQESKSSTRLEIIANHKPRWIIANVFFALAGILTAIGLVIFCLKQPGSVKPWLISAAATAFVLGTIAWVLLMISRAANPKPYFERYTFTPFTLALFWLTLVGLLLFGIVYFQAGFPSWLAIGTILGTALIGVAALFFPARFYSYFPPQVFYLFTLAAGIVMLN